MDLDYLAKRLLSTNRALPFEYLVCVFKIAPGGHLPQHQHDWERVNYIISGKGRLMMAGTGHEIVEKDFAFVPPHTLHQFRNRYDHDLEFICIVPNRGEK
jgi:quercetin dioxygenase-like cupin family protein